MQLAADAAMLRDWILEQMSEFRHDHQPDVRADCLVLADALEECGLNGVAEYWRKVAAREWWPVMLEFGSSKILGSRLPKEWARDLCEWRMAKSGTHLPCTKFCFSFLQAILDGERVMAAMHQG